MPQLARTTALRNAAVRAVLAPSVHNTQPWSFHLTPDSLEVHADWSRRLLVLDARGRQLLLSCGCALLNARAALAATGTPARVERFPDPSRPEVLARLVLADDVVPPDGPDDALARLDAAIPDRRTTRTRFARGRPPAELLTVLVAAAAAEGTELLALDPGQARTVVRLSRRADQVEDATPGYRHELDTWTGGDPGRVDGVPTPAGAARRPTSGGPDTRGTGFLDDYADPAAGALLLLGTRHDTQSEWLRAGEALERVLLELTAAGYAASTLMQVVEVPETNAGLRAELGLAMHPQVLLRVGRADDGPATRRRRLVDVLSEVA